MSAERIAAVSLRSKIHEVSQTHLGSRHPLSFAAQNGTFGEIFSWVNTLGTYKKTEIVNDLFTSSDLPIPNGAAVANFILEVLPIARVGTLTPPEEKNIRNEIREYQLGFQQPSLPVRIVRPDMDQMERMNLEEIAGVWPAGKNPSLVDKLIYKALTTPSPLNHAREQLRQDMERAPMEGKKDKGGIAYTSGRIEAYNAVAQMVYEAINTTAGWAAVPLTFGALFELLADQMPADKYPRGNPYEPLKRLYKMGCIPIGVINSEFFVYVPQKELQFPETGWEKFVYWLKSQLKGQPSVISPSFAVTSEHGETPHTFVDRLQDESLTRYQSAVITGYYVSRLLSSLGMHVLLHDVQIPHIQSESSVFSQKSLSDYHTLVKQVLKAKGKGTDYTYPKEGILQLDEEWKNRTVSNLKYLQRSLTDSVRKEEMARFDQMAKGKNDTEQDELAFKKRTLDREEPVEGKRTLETLDRLIRVLGKEKNVNPMVMDEFAQEFRAYFYEAGISYRTDVEISNLIDEYYGINTEHIVDMLKHFQQRE